MGRHVGHRCIVLFGVVGWATSVPEVDLVLSNSSPTTVARAVSLCKKLPCVSKSAFKIVALK